MPRRNRVTPLGELVAVPDRGLVFGNRGCLHDESGEIRRPHAGRRWIACRLRFRGRRRAPLMAAGRYTELFFLDDATALAAGHRACAECRRGDYERLRSVWSELHPEQHGAEAIDAQLHAERVDPETGRRRLHQASFTELPDGAFVIASGIPCLVLGWNLLAWSAGGYGERLRRPRRATAAVITPPSLVALLGAGWSPAVALVHPTALPSGPPGISRAPAT